MTLQAVADLAGLHPTSVDKIERCERSPTWLTVCDLADALDLPVSVLIADAEDAVTPSDEEAIALAWPRPRCRSGEDLKPSRTP